MSSTIFEYVNSSRFLDKTLADTYFNASKALAALFNTVLEFVGRQPVPNVLGGK